MTNLPVTLVEVKALKYTKECVRFIHTESMRLIGLSWFSKEGSRWFSRHIMKQSALASPSTMDAMISQARAGWHDAHEALGDLIKEFNARGTYLPPQVASYNIHAWDQRLSSPPGRRKSDNVTRNIADALIIEATCKYFPLKPTRHRHSKPQPPRRQSAAAILAQAHKEELPPQFFKPSARALEAMWETDGPFLLKFATTGLRPQIPLPIPEL